MSRKHVLPSDLGMSARSVTRRDALRLLIGAGACATLLPAVAAAETAQEKADAAQDAYEQTQKELDAAKLNFDEAQSELDRIGEEYAAIAGQLSQTQNQISEVSQQIEQKQEDIEDKQDEIDSTQRQIEAKQATLGERMSAAYKSGPSSTLDLILSSASFDELTSNIYYLDKISEADQNMIEEVKDLKSSLETQKAELETEKTELEAQKSSLQTLEAQQQAQLSEAQAKQDEAQALVSSLSAEVQELMAQRDAELIAAQEAAEEAKRIEEERKKQEEQQQQGGGSSSGGGGIPPITGSGSLSAVVSASYSTPSPGSGLCAAWVSNVFRNAGVGSFGGNACDMYHWYCGYPTSQIQPGMIIAVPTAPFSAAAVIYGHVGIYVGNGTVRHNQSGVVKSDSLSSWVSLYSRTATVLCGWLGGVQLS